MAGLELSNTIVKHSVAKTYSLYLSDGIYDDTQKEFLNDLRIVTEHPTNATLKLFINSPGGYVHIMNEIIYYIQEYSRKRMSRVVYYWSSFFSSYCYLYKIVATGL